MTWKFIWIFEQWQNYYYYPDQANNISVINGNNKMGHILKTYVYVFYIDAVL